ncbi:hypothetical protein JB92DRAFT_2957604 [Gautieria morchelliformis]|nr:hypothetical protein JB92DRAFT_2957604 [Gautieria morchelliformis]
MAMTGPAGSFGLQSIIGPLFIGLLLSVGFQGILGAQGYWYCKTYGNKDSLIFRNFVFGLCALELLHTIVSAHAGYWYLIKNFNQPTAIDHLVWSILVELALTVIITFIGRAFWIRRLHILSHRNWRLTLVTSIFSGAQLGLGIGEVYEGIRQPSFSTILDGKFTIIAQMLSADLGDLIISLSLCYYLNASRSGVQSTEMLIDRLIVFVVTRGILASGTGFVQLITFVIWPNTFIFGAFHLIASKLYTNAFLATLNAREHISGLRSNRDATDEGDTGTSFVLSSVTGDREVRSAIESNFPTGRRPPLQLFTSRRDTQDHIIAVATPSSSLSAPPTASKGHCESTPSTITDMDKADHLS